MTFAGEWTAAAVSEAVRTGAADATDVVAEAIVRIETRDPAWGAYQVVRAEKALAEAAAVMARPDRDRLPLAGVPIAVKDNVPVQGEPMRVGSAATDDTPQPEDHPVVRRLRDAGAVVVGLTRVPELCVYGATDSVHGITRNPWDPARTPGGSSGGSAAAVASGTVPAAHGNDGMGSVRIPAACCGLVGIKPGFGVVPAELGVNDWSGLSENGALATTVADAATMLSVMAAQPAMAQLRDPQSRLRIAVSTKPPVQGVAVDREHVRAVFEVAGTLMRAGHDVGREEIRYPQAAAMAGLARWFAGTAAEADELDDARLEPRVRAHAALGRRVRGTVLMSESWRDSWRTKAAEFLAGHDVLMTPVLAQPPIEAKAWGQGSWAASMAANIRYAPFAAPWNVAGFPAMAVPAGVHPGTGTPLSVQLVAAPGREHLLLSLAAVIERLHPWPRVAPAYAG